jgi:SAM-dependent methyltransferase
MQKLVSLVTRFIPRKYLHHVSHFFLKTLAMAYRGKGFVDPINGKSYRKFLPYGRLHSRKNALSPATLSLERHRLMWLFLQQKTHFFTDRLKVLHIAPEYCFISLFKKCPNLDYLTGDLDSPLADIHLDINQLPFEDNHFDVIFCNHVLEHIPDDVHAMRELCRVLRPGGWAILQVPMRLGAAHTEEDITLTDPKERERRFLQDDHFRLYGLDYKDRLEKAGFQVHIDKMVDEMPATTRDSFALMPGEWLYVGIKPGAPARGLSFQPQFSL